MIALRLVRLLIANTKARLNQSDAASSASKVHAGNFLRNVKSRECDLA
jgi:hypothetical protein